MLIEIFDVYKIKEFFPDKCDVLERTKNLTNINVIVFKFDI